MLHRHFSPLAVLLFVICACTPTRGKLQDPGLVEELETRRGLPPLPRQPPADPRPEVASATPDALSVDAIVAPTPSNPDRKGAWLRWERPCEQGRCAGEPVWLGEATQLNDVGLIDLKGPPLRYHWDAWGDTRQLPRSAEGMVMPAALVVLSWRTPELRTTHSREVRLVRLPAEGEALEPDVIWRLRAAYDNATGSQSPVNSLDFVEDPARDLLAIEFHSTYYGHNDTSSAPVHTERFSFDGAHYDFGP